MRRLLPSLFLRGRTLPTAWAAVPQRTATVRLPVTTESRRFVSDKPHLEFSSGSIGTQRKKALARLLLRKDHVRAESHGYRITSVVTEGKAASWVRHWPDGTKTKVHMDFVGLKRVVSPRVTLTTLHFTLAHKPGESSLMCIVTPTETVATEYTANDNRRVLRITGLNWNSYVEQDSLAQKGVKVVWRFPNSDYAGVTRTQLGSTKYLIRPPSAVHSLLLWAKGTDVRRGAQRADSFTVRSEKHPAHWKREYNDVLVDVAVTRVLCLMQRRQGGWVLQRREHEFQRDQGVAQLCIVVAGTRKLVYETVDGEPFDNTLPLKGATLTEAVQHMEAVLSSSLIKVAEERMSATEIEKESEETSYYQAHLDGRVA